MGKMMTLDDAAEHAAASKRTLRRLISSGELKAYRLGKQLVRIDSDDLAALFVPIVPSVAKADPPAAVKRVRPKSQRRTRTGVA
jgi:excisionase family DNA binding protein